MHSFLIISCDLFLLFSFVSSFQTRVNPLRVFHCMVAFTLCPFARTLIINCHSVKNHFLKSEIKVYIFGKNPIFLILCKMFSLVLLLNLTFLVRIPLNKKSTRRLRQKQTTLCFITTIIDNPKFNPILRLLML